MDRHGADAVRWFMAAGGSPWSARRVGHKVLEEIASKVIRTYWSIASFQSLYARANGWKRREPARGEPTLLDAWALSEAHRTALLVDAALEDFDTARAGKVIADYIDDLSNWYVRRSRRRFWDGDPAALATLHECLDVLTLLHGAVHPVRHRAGLVGAVRPSGRAARLGAPGALAGDRRGFRRSRRCARRAGRARPAGGRAGPGGPCRIGSQDPPATGPGAGVRARLVGRARAACAARSPTS